MGNRKKSVKILASIVIICVILLVVLAIIIVPSLKEWLVLLFEVKPEPLTELYFENHLDLPEKVNAMEKNSFSFTIHNLENEDMEYSYNVYFDINGEKKIIKSGTVSLKNDEYGKTDVEYTVPLTSERVKVVVDLADMDQEISFWIEKVEGNAVIVEDQVDGAIEGDQVESVQEGIDEETQESEKVEEKEVQLEPPLIILKIHSGPFYTDSGDICYYRIIAEVTGNPLPEVEFSKDDSLGNWGPFICQVNIEDPEEIYTLTATAVNSEGEESDSITIEWGYPE